MFKEYKKNEKTSLTSGLDVKIVQECIIVGQAHQHLLNNLIT